MKTWVSLVSGGCVGVMAPGHPSDAEFWLFLIPAMVLVFLIRWEARASDLETLETVVAALERASLKGEQTNG